MRLKTLKKMVQDRDQEAYCSSNVVRVIKYRRLRRAGHVARMEEGKNISKNFQEGKSRKD